jgi:hypothetical protein
LPRGARHHSFSNNLIHRALRALAAEPTLLADSIARSSGRKPGATMCHGAVARGTCFALTP